MATRTLHPVVERILTARGVFPGGLDDFFDTSMRRVASSGALPGLADAVATILPFLRDGRQIVVFGDYDCDGVCAAAILVKALRFLRRWPRPAADAAGVGAFIPDRFAEGYGMTDASVKRMLAEFPKVALVVTVDTGTSSPAEVAELNARGVAVVVTDHHIPGCEPPKSVPLVNPHAEGLRPAEELVNLCGAGVAFFLARALADAAAGDPAIAYDGSVKFGAELLVLAGIATVADVVPLSGVNRALVQQACACFPGHAPIGVRELLLRAGRRAADLTSRDFGFVLSPRLNASGRMGNALMAFDLLMETDREKARARAMEIDHVNVARKTAEQEVYRAVEAQVEGAVGAVVAYDETDRDGALRHAGVVGIVASRLVEKTGLPAAVYAGSHGSVRAPEGYNVHAALEAASAALERSGGHALAGGFSVKPGRFEEFRRLFSAACARQAVGLAERAAVRVDAWVEPRELTFDLVAAIAELEPFGEGNREPVLGLAGVAFSDARLVGQDGVHAAFSFVNRAIPRAMWWNHGYEVEALRRHAAARHDVFFVLRTSTFGDVEPHLELGIVAVRPASGAAVG